MSPTLDEQIKQLIHTIVEMEAQRDALGDEVVDAALVPLQLKLDELVSLLEPPGEPISEPPTQQRKLVTLLFMDVVGSTSAIAAHLDPEDTLEIMDSALKRLAIPIEEHGGHVTRFMGDGFKAVFGAPLAREDDPDQAVHAGLDILEAARTIANELEAHWVIQGFQVRVGVNTGLVALGGLTEAEDTVMGKPVNLAARLESAAPPGGLLISHDTYRHIRGVFDVEPQEPILAKGFDEPVPVYLVLRAKPRAFRVLELGVEGVETSMVGRHDELKHLQDILIIAIKESEGQVVTVTGEAGVGKSRLLYEFDNWIELLPQNVRFFQGRGQQEFQGLPYALLRDLFTFRFQIQDDDRAKVVREKVETGFGEVFGSDKDGLMRAHILGQLMGFDFTTSPHLKGVLNDAEQLRNRGLMYMGEYFIAVANEMPTVVILEDIHWADDSSLDAVNHLGHRTPQIRLLIVCAARPSLFERRPHWGEGLEFHRRLNLEPLSKWESRQLVDEILRLVDKIPLELRELVVRGAEGNPFYIEELIKMLVENQVIIKGEETWQIETERLAQIEVPSTLAGVLQARLDDLPYEERVVLQQASVVGRQFWDRVIAYIHTSGEGRPEIVPEVLTSLRGRELIYHREESAFVDTHEYIFKHDLLREVTYESVLKRLRKVFHELVAMWLIEQSAERIKEYSGLIAEHLLLAGKKDQSLEFFIQAGEAALASYANPEAEQYFRQALALSPTETQRAALLSGLGDALSRQGHTEEAIQVYRQGIDLYQSLGDTDAMADLYTRSSLVFWFSGDHSESWNTCQEGLTVLEDAPDSPGLARLLAEAGRTAFFSGAVDEVPHLCQKAMQMAERLEHVEVQSEARITLALLSKDEEDAVDVLEEVVNVAEAHELLRTASRACNNLGVFLVGMGKIASAHDYYMRAVEFDRWMGDAASMCFTLLNAIYTALYLGDLQTAEQIHGEITQVQSITREPWAEINLLHARAGLMKYAGEWILSMESFCALLVETKRGGDLQMQSDLASTLAFTFLEANRFDGYNDWVDVVAALKETLDIPIEITMGFYLRYRLAILFARQGRLVEAHQLYREERLTYEEGDSYLDVMERLWVEYELAFAEERWQEAVNAAESMIEICERTDHFWFLARQLINLSDALVHRDQPNDLERAREGYQRSLEMFTEMGASGYIKVLEERLQSLNSENKV
jgi:class 3 adenylate cyclase/tetratricopeptide (TPR) repeat protein